MVTLSESGLITDAMVDDEIGRLTRLWRRHGHASMTDDLLEVVLGKAAAQLDRFDAAQLRDVFAVCRHARSLFAVSPAAKARPNEADRLKKYLARFDPDWEQVSAAKLT